MNNKHQGLNAPEEYISTDDFPDFTCDVVNLDAASHSTFNYVKARLAAIAETTNRPLALMLSGGVDSLLTLAAAARLDIDAHAFTVHWSGSRESARELAMAKKAAHNLGIDVHVISPGLDEYRGLVRRVMTQLETAEPWEVLAGTILLAVKENADIELPESPIISSAGADSLFLGGKHFSPADDNAATVQQWQEQVRASVTANFQRGRFIPDFFDRILGDESRHYKVWQTKQAVELASHMHPRVVKGLDWEEDKILLRWAAYRTGIPPAVLTSTKSPMQVSSGGIRALEDIARSDLARKYASHTYSDPMTDDGSFIIARLFLELLHSKQL